RGPGRLVAGLAGLASGRLGRRRTAWCGRHALEEAACTRGLHGAAACGVGLALRSRRALRLALRTAGRADLGAGAGAGAGVGVGVGVGSLVRIGSGARVLCRVVATHGMTLTPETFMTPSS